MMGNFAFYSTDINPTTDPANADPAPSVLVILDQDPIIPGSYDMAGGEVGRGSVITTLGGAVIQDFGVFDCDKRISFSDNDALDDDTVAALKVLHETVDGEYYFTDGNEVWKVRFARPNGFKYRKNLFWKEYDLDINSYEINLIVVGSGTTTTTTTTSTSSSSSTTTTAP
jgi:hypothetical protein